MISSIKCLTNLQENLHRTEMLIDATERIKGYNFIYQAEAFKNSLEYGKIVEQVQNKRLREIEVSCSEHAIISLSTVFEAFYKDLVQELFYNYPTFFYSEPMFEEKLKALVDKEEELDHEVIAKELKLKNRFDYYRFFEQFDIPFLNENEKELIEYIYTLRNNFVHNAGRKDSTTIKKLDSIAKPVKEDALTTQSKRLRTKLKRLLPKVYQKVSGKFSSS